MVPMLTLLANNLTAVTALAAIAAVSFFLYLFRKELRGAINRWGLEAPQTPDQKLSSKQTEIAPKDENLISVKSDSIEAKELASELAKILASSPYSLERQLEISIIDLANKTIRLDFEIVYRLIYGSQFEALQSLRKDGPQPLAKFHQTFLDRVQNVYGESQHKSRTDFEAWAGFLTNRAYPLVTINGGIARITNRGEEFLSYVSVISLSAPPSVL